jgi:hypothetical protein
MIEKSRMPMNRPAPPKSEEIPSPRARLMRADIVFSLSLVAGAGDLISSSYQDRP